MRSPIILSAEDRTLVDRRVLVVDDDPTVAEVATRYFRAAGCHVEQVGDGFDALAVATRWAPDLIVLDRMLPGVDGIEVCRRLRQSSSTPIIMLTALGLEDDRILGLEAGADDYLAKPFSPRELILRARSVLRRSPSEFVPVALVALGDFELDPAARRASRAGSALTLTGREFDLLAFLLHHPAQAFSREELLSSVWGWTYGDLSTVTVHVRRLREKIEVDATHPAVLVTVWGVGYRFDVAPAEENPRA
ncbi:MAG: hypothetical protein RI885_2544 [Actinomycetota bacterium]|jgi:DNA-binding response OmpR family regulator